MTLKKKNCVTLKNHIQTEQKHGIELVIVD